MSEVYCNIETCNYNYNNKCTKGVIMIEEKYSLKDNNFKETICRDRKE